MLRKMKLYRYLLQKWQSVKSWQTGWLQLKRLAAAMNGK